jgi:hypothetical protein
MKRVNDMTARLPYLYREGQLLTGVLSQPAEQLEIAVEDALEVQRAHFFDDALQLEEVARLAALLDFTPEQWQTLQLFRPWVHAQRDAVLKSGGVTVDAIVGFATSYLAAFQAATGNFFPSAKPGLVEYPVRRRYGNPDLADDTAPLSRFTITMKGLDDTYASLLLTGTEAGPESMPLIANLTTGDALLFHGNVAPGQRLWLRAASDGSVTAQLERDDVTAKLVSITGITPGTAWDAPQITTPAKALPLVRGDNSLWFLPVAHFDELGLDRFMLALADLAMVDGHWDSSNLDHSIFYLAPAINMRLTWLEMEPASIALHVHTESVYRAVPSPGSATDARDQIAFALDDGVKRLRAAGVRSDVAALAFSELQPATDFMTSVLPKTIREAGAGGADRLIDNSGMFGQTGWEDSIFQ